MAVEVEAPRILDVRSTINSYGLTGSLLSFLGLLILLPIGVLLLYSLRMDGKWTIEVYRDVFSQPEFSRALQNTIIIAFSSVAISVFMGVTLAWIIGRTDVPFRGVFHSLNMIPFFMSVTIGALTWEILSAPRSGVLNQLARSLFGHETVIFDIHSNLGMALVIGLYYTPYVYLFVLGSLKNMDPVLEEAARVSGAGLIGTCFKVTLPLAAPAILSSGLLVLATAISIFSVPLVLGAPARINTLSTLVYRYINSYPMEYSKAAVLSMTQLVFTGILVWMQVRIVARREFTTVTGKGYKAGIVELGHLRYVAAAVNIFYLATVFIPLLMLLVVSFQSAWTGQLFGSSLTLKNYRTVIFVDAVTWRALRNSIIISLLGATVGTLAGLLLSAVIYRSTLPWRRAVDYLSLSPAAIPGIVMGLAFLLVWIHTPLYGTVWVLVIVYVTHFLPTSVRNISSSLLSISKELDDAAQICGAYWAKRIWVILVPILKPTLTSTWVLLYVTFMREVACSLMLYTFGTETISVALIRLLETALIGVASALSVLQILIVLAVVSAIQAWLRSLSGVGYGVD